MATYQSIIVTIGAMRMEALAAETASEPSRWPMFIALQLSTPLVPAVLGPARENDITGELDIDPVGWALQAFKVLRTVASSAALGILEQCASRKSCLCVMPK